MEIGHLKLFHIVIRVPKQDSAFFYFLLESHEGLAFYSTLRHENGQTFRDIDMKGPIELLNPLIHLIDRFRADSPESTILLKEEIVE